MSFARPSALCSSSISTHHFSRLLLITKLSDFKPNNSFISAVFPFFRRKLTYCPSDCVHSTFCLILTDSGLSSTKSCYHTCSAHFARTLPFTFNKNTFEVNAVHYTWLLSVNSLFCGVFRVLLYHFCGTCANKFDPLWPPRGLYKTSIQ